MLEVVDILYIIMAIAIALVSIFFSIVLVYAILILRDVNKASEAVKDSAERVNAMIVKPLKMTKEILKYAKPVVEVAEKKFHEQANAKKKKKSTSKKKS
jgi:hypothetical protein